MPYSTNIQPQNYLVGQIADSNLADFKTRKNVNSSLSIPFGIAMIIDPTNDGYNLPTQSSDITNRMAINTIGTRATNAAYVSGVWTAGDVSSCAPGTPAVGVLKGDIAVTVEENVNEGDPCFIRFAAGSGGNTQLGAFRKSADVVSSNPTAAVHPDWYFLTTATAGKTAVVRCQ